MNLIVAVVGFLIAVQLLFIAIAVVRRKRQVRQTYEQALAELVVFYPALQPRSAGHEWPGLVGLWEGLPCQIQVAKRPSGRVVQVVFEQDVTSATFKHLTIRPRASLHTAVAETLDWSQVLQSGSIPPDYLPRLFTAVPHLEHKLRHTMTHLSQDQPLSTVHVAVEPGRLLCERPLDNLTYLHLELAGLLLSKLAHTIPSIA